MYNTAYCRYSFYSEFYMNWLTYWAKKGVFHLLTKTLMPCCLRHVWTFSTSIIKYWRSGVPTGGSLSRRISRLCNLSWVEAELENWRIEIELLDLESSIESNIKANIKLLAEFLSIKVEFNSSQVLKICINGS